MIYGRNHFFLLIYVIAIIGVTMIINSRSQKNTRVFPLIPEHQQQPRLRTDETYDMFMKEYMKKEKSFTYNELRDRYRGHVSSCVLLDPAHFDVGTSFLSDSLHNIYHGAVVCTNHAF